MGPERRRAQRLESKLFVDFETLPLKESLGRGVVLDVSLGGFGVESELDMEFGQTYLCQLEIPLVLKAKVVRREIKGQIKRYGLQFTNAGFFDRMVLKRMLKGRLETKKVQ
jgi:hypothetical protein